MEISNRETYMTEESESAARKHRAASNILFDFGQLQEYQQQQQQQPQSVQPRQRTPSIYFPPTPISQKHRSASHQDATRPRNASIFKGTTFLFQDSLNNQLESQETMKKEQHPFALPTHHCQKKNEICGILREQKLVAQSGRLHSQNLRQQITRKSVQNVSSLAEQEKQPVALTEQDKNRVSMKEYVMELQDNKGNNLKTPTTATAQLSKQTK